MAASKLTEFEIHFISLDCCVRGAGGSGDDTGIWPCGCYIYEEVGYTYTLRACSKPIYDIVGYAELKIPPG